MSAVTRWLSIADLAKYKWFFSQHSEHDTIENGLFLLSDGMRLKLYFLLLCYSFHFTMAIYLLDLIAVGTVILIAPIASIVMACDLNSKNVSPF